MTRLQPSKAKLLRFLALWEQNKAFILKQVKLSSTSGLKYFPYQAELEQEKIDYVKNRYKSILE